MACASKIKTSAPGSLMLLGEHAVLHGRRALACAVSCRVRVFLEAARDRRLVIDSALGRYEGALDALRPEGPLRFVLAAVREAGAAAGDGLRMRIESDFSHTVGLGSSAAVTVAATAALLVREGIDDPAENFARSRRAVRAVQGLGSGTDVAASVWGGIVAYRAEPFEIVPLDAVHPITLVYSGAKRPTVEVVREVEAARTADPARFEALFDAMDGSVGEAVDAIRGGDWRALGGLLDRNQGLMRELGVSNGALDAIVAWMKQHPDILGAKISGSGLGDCVVGLGRAAGAPEPFERIDVQMSAEGVRVEQA